MSPKRRGPIRFPYPNVIKDRYIAYTEGHVEIEYNGSWGTICDDSFDDAAANVVCHMAGYLYGEYNSGKYNQPDLHFKAPLILLDNVECTGQERSIGMCKHAGWSVHNCNHREVYFYVYTSIRGCSIMTSPGKGGREVNKNGDFHCFHGDRGGREVWKW